MYSGKCAGTEIKVCVRHMTGCGTVSGFVSRESSFLTVCFTGGNRPFPFHKFSHKRIDKSKQMFYSINRTNVLYKSKEITHGKRR